MSVLALCIESSHAKGMGHLFRAAHLAEALRRAGKAPLFLLNDDAPSLAVLRGRGLPFECVPLEDAASGWETRLIRDRKISAWVDDRLETTVSHARSVKAAGIPLICIDDQGQGASQSDLHFATMPCFFDKELGGRKVLRGPQYLILDPAIAALRKRRTNGRRALVTLGGTDTYGVTLKVLAILKRRGIPASILTGPGFRHRSELMSLADAEHPAFGPAEDLPAVFPEYDWAVTGGGMTAFEANASGLPCVIVANEPHEVPNARYLHALGSSVFAGHHESIDESVFSGSLDIAAMSARGLDGLTVAGAENVCRELLRLA